MMRPLLKENARTVDVALRVFDLCVLTVAFPLAYVVRDGALGSEFSALKPLSSYWPVLAVTMLLWIGAAAVCRVYEAYRTRSVWFELRRIGAAEALVALGLGALAFFSKQQELSRLFIALYSAVSLVLLVVDRGALRLIARKARRRGYNTRRFAVAGTGPLAREAASRVLGHPEWGYEFAGYLLEADGDAAPGPALGPISTLRRVLELEVVDEIIVALSSPHGDQVHEILHVAEERGIRVKLCMDFSLLKISRISYEDLDDIPTFAFSPVPTDPIALAAKRGFDIAFSTLVLLLALPVLLLILAAIRFDSPGPVFFRQRRVGMNGRLFNLWKFRTMCIDAEAQLAHLRALNEVGGPVFKMRNDPRVTRVGRWLRKSSLDEFPQFWNVLKGDMSVVGPRPPIPAEVEKYQSWQRRRLSVKPGITCVWQVSGRSGVDFDQWMELDLDYIDHWSLWSDLGIILKTVPAVLFGRGAH